MTHYPTLRSPRKQRGVALLVVLMLLLIMTLLGLASLRGSIMEERMSANLFDRGLMFQAAEAALRQGEDFAATTKPAQYDAACTNGLCTAPSTTADVTLVNRWLLPNPPYKAASTVSSGTLTVTPGYFIEFMGSAPNWPGCDRENPIQAGCLGPRYRVTARATAAGRSQVILQSSFTSPE
jgi:type IV pilus assembly protein PilX